MTTATKRTTGLFISLLLATLGSACAPPDTHTYKLYPGSPRPSLDLARIGFGPGVTSFRVDGLRVHRADYEIVELLPGEHEIEIDWVVASDVLMTEMQADRYEAEARVVVELASGIEYIVRVDRDDWWEHPRWRDRRIYLWIEHAATGYLVAGEKKP
jgi:hypothetical protein